MSIPRLAGLLLAASFLCACSSLPTEVELKLVTTPDLNRNDKGQSTPVTIRLFRLRNTELFDKATFAQLYDDPKKALADSLVGEPLEIDLGAAERLPKQIELPPGVQFVGVMGLFNTEAPDQQWRTVHRSDEIGDLELVFQGFTVKGKPPKLP